MRVRGSRFRSLRRSSLNRSSDSGVTTSRARRGDGIQALIRAGVRNTTASVISPTATAAGFGVGSDSRVPRDSTTPPRVLTPMKGPSWSTRMMAPIPDMKPDTTE